jgi:gamma-glutamylcyclotransferase (GGCT)/AIG2-like uncharacterized protein YtfP
MTWHFAYGSNMSRALMGKRCPGAVALGPAQLRGWRYMIMGDGYASVVPEPGATVHGVLWRVTPRDLAALNAYEALHTGLYRRRLLSVRHARGVVPALVYLARSRALGRARAGYQDGIVLPAARDWGLPDSYLAELTRWVPASAHGRGLVAPGASV